MQQTTQLIQYTEGLYNADAFISLKLSSNPALRCVSCYSTDDYIGCIFAEEDGSSVTSRTFYRRSGYDNRVMRDHLMLEVAVPSMYPLTTCIGVSLLEPTYAYGGVNLWFSTKDAVEHGIVLNRQQAEEFCADIKAVFDAAENSQKI